MIVQRLHALLRNLYDVESQYDVADFLVTDRRALFGMELANDCPSCDEQLLMTHSEQSAHLCLFIDDPVLRRLELQDPMGALTEGNLSDYCTALEGVSHFLYATWRLHHDSPVSLLELETQAEVDKFAVTVLLLANQGGGRYPAYAFGRLFEGSTFDTRLDAEQLNRYRTAHHCAAHYCRFLERSFVKRGETQVEAMLRELRKFYRLRNSAKLNYALGARAIS